MSVYVVGSGVALYVIDLLVLYNISFLYINIVEPNSSRGYESKKEATNERTKEARNGGRDEQSRKMTG